MCEGRAQPSSRFLETSRRASAPAPSLGMTQYLRGQRYLAFAALLGIGGLDSAARGASVTFIPFLLGAKGIDAAGVGLYLTLLFTAGAAGKFELQQHGAHQRGTTREVVRGVKRRKRARAVTMAKQFDERRGSIEGCELARRTWRQNR